MNFTALIHYHKDSAERERNLKATKAYLENQGANVLVADDLKYNVNGWVHRTRAINDLCRIANTDYIGVWDADAIIPPDQLSRAIVMLKSFSCVYPYDGEFRRYQEEPTQAFASDLDADKLRSTRGFWIQTPAQKGGAVMFQRDVYMQLGMENENFISHAPEDKERYSRFSKLATVGRVDGPLLHLNHEIKQHSSNNPYHDAGLEEFRKVDGMTADQLRDYISTWPWMQEKVLTDKDEILAAIRGLPVVPKEFSFDERVSRLSSLLTPEERMKKRDAFLSSLRGDVRAERYARLDIANSRTRTAQRIRRIRK